jgi:hypothetical protein
MSRLRANILFLFLFFCICLSVTFTLEQENVEYYNLNTERTKSFDDYYNGSDHFLRQTLQGYEDKCQVREHPDTPDYYWFAPSRKAILNENNISDNFQNNCFQSNTVTLEKLTKEETVLRFEAAEAAHWYCKDSYLISTTAIHQVKFVYMSGVSKVVLYNLTDDDMADIKINGIKVYGFCQGFFNSLRSLFQTFELYLGGLGNSKDAWIPLFRPTIPWYMEDANIDFMQRYLGFKQIHRGSFADSILNIDEKEIKSGDFIAIHRLDGVDPLIMLGSGSHIGHTCVCLWIEGELYVVESQSGWYWPKQGIQKNKFKQWIQWAKDADFNVVLLPLKEEVRAKFDVEKAIQFYNSVEGLNYGFHNFVFTWLDTEKDNWPAWVDSDLLFTAVALFSRVTRSLADIMFGEGLNHRLGTKGLSVEEVIVKAASQGISTGNLFAMPEGENWEYSDGKNYVCSCLAIALYKAAGVFGDLEILPNEFGPKDVYELNIFDKSYKDRRPDVCKQADPELDYCQLIGKYKITLNNYATIEPYSHMNERCPSIAPNFIRPDGC